MNGAVDQLLARLRDEDAVLVRVESTQGSAPREAGTWMAVWAEGLTATIGGGQLRLNGTPLTIKGVNRHEHVRDAQGFERSRHTASRPLLKPRTSPLSGS